MGSILTEVDAWVTAAVLAAAMLAAGSVLGEGREVPAGHLAAGVPAEVKKELSGSSAGWVERTARTYQEAGRAYRAGLVDLPSSG